MPFTSTHKDPGTGIITRKEGGRTVVIPVARPQEELVNKSHATPHKPVVSEQQPSTPTATESPVPAVETPVQAARTPRDPERPRPMGRRAKHAARNEWRNGHQ